MSARASATPIANEKDAHRTRSQTVQRIGRLFGCPSIHSDQLGSNRILVGLVRGPGLESDASRSCPVRLQARRPRFSNRVPHGPARCVLSVKPPQSHQLLPSEFRSADDSDHRTPRLR